MSADPSLRGACQQMSAQYVLDHPELILTIVRGHYICPLWGKQAHWWCVDQMGKIHDPTVGQFPTHGRGAEYVPFDGFIECEECGKRVAEKDARIEGNGHHAFCCSTCFGIFVGVLDPNGNML